MLEITYFATDDDYRYGLITTRTLPAESIEEAIEIVKNWPWKVKRWEFKKQL